LAGNKSAGGIKEKISNKEEKRGRKKEGRGDNSIAMLFGGPVKGKGS